MYTQNRRSIRETEKKIVFSLSTLSLFCHVWCDSCALYVIACGNFTGFFLFYHFPCSKIRDGI